MSRHSSCKFGLLITIIFVLMLAPLTLPAWAVTPPSYLAGVTAGQYATYKPVRAVYEPYSNAPQAIKDLNATLQLNSTIEIVSSPARNVTGQKVINYDNGTSETEGFFVDLLTGDGNATDAFIAGGLSATQQIYQNVTAPSINATVTMTYLGAQRQVNVYNLTNSRSGPGYTSVEKLSMIWDQASGILLELSTLVSFSSTSGNLYENLDVLITATNVFTHPPPDFKLTANPSSLSFAAGSTGSSVVTIQGENGFTGTVTLTISVNATGLSASCGPLNSNIVIETSNCGFSSSTVGAFNVTVKGTSGTLTHSVSVIVTVTPAPDFYLTTNTTSITFLAGETRTVTVTVSSQNGFAGVVSLTSNSTSCTVSPTSVTGSGSAALSCTFSSAQIVHVMVTGTSGSRTHTATVMYAIQDFTVTASPTAVTVVSGSPATSSIAVAAVDGFNGVVSLTTNSTACAVSPTSVTGSGSATLSCTFTSNGTKRVSVIGASAGLSHSVTVTFQLQDFTITANPSSANVNVNTASTSTITVTAVDGFAGVVSLVTNSTACAVTPARVTGGGSAVLSCTFSAVSMVQVGVTGTSGSLSHSVTIAFAVQDFTITASPTSVIVNAGSAGSSTITVTGLNGFAGAVSLITNSALCTVSPTSIAGSSSATLSCTFTSASTAYVWVTATNGALSHSVAVTFVVQDFTITASPSSVTINANSQRNSTITVTGLNGFAGVVSLTTNSTLCTVSPASVNGSGSMTLNCTFASAQIVHVTVTGASGSRTQTATVTYTIQDFTVAATPTSVTLVAGARGTSTIAVTSVNGFAGTVTFTSSVPHSAGVDCTLSPTSVTIGTSGTSMLSCSGSAGTYTVTLTGSSGSLSHSTPVTVTVTSIQEIPNAQTINLGLTPLVFYSTIAAVVAVVAAVLLAAFRMRRRPGYRPSQ